jgi:hypothetical protein
MSYRQIFKDYNIVTLSSLCKLEVIYFIKRDKYFMKRKLDIHNHNTTEKANLHA